MKQIFTLILLIAFLSVQAAKIKGKVTDRNNEPLIGATIALEGIGQYTTTGLDGSFSFNKVPNKNYQIKISYVGFKTREIPVSVKAKNQTVEVKVVLSEHTANLNQVSIVGQAEGSSIAKARSREKRAENIINAISGQSIQLSSDITVSDVLQRVSGVSLEKRGGGSGATYAIIRGMPKRYNYTLINGIKIPSPNNKNRYISMNIFPSDLLDRLEVYKSLTPSMEGDAVGGAVNMVMKSAPDKFLITSELSVGYHGIFANRPFNYAQTNYINKYSPFELKGPYYFAKSADFTTQNMNMQATRVTPDIRASLTIGNRYLNDRLGLIISGSFNNYFSGTEGVRFNPSIRRDGTSKPELTKMTDRFYYNHINRSGVYFMTDFHLNKNNYFKLFTTYLYLNNNQLRRQISYRLWGVNPNNLNVKTYNDRFRKTTQQIFNVTLKGLHKLNKHTKVDWTLAYSKAKQERPDNAEFVRVSNYSLIQNKESILVAEDGDNYRRWEHNSDNDLSGYLNFTHTFSGKNYSVTLKSGLFFRKKTRSSFIVTYRYNPAPAIQAYGYKWKPDDSNVKYGTWEKFSDVTWNVRNPQGTTRDELNYDAHENTGAFYLQVTAVYNKWQLITGARATHANQGYLLLAPRVGENPEADHIYFHILPGFHLKYKINEHSNLRASWFYSFILPGYFEIVPYIYAGEDYINLGNPGLKPIQANNFDLRYGNYSNTQNYLTVGVFYKIIYDPIEYVLENGIALGVKSVVRRPSNFGTAINYGMEIDYTRYFRNFGIALNYTYTHSSITTSKSLIRRKNPQDPSSSLVTETVSQTRPLQGQADNIGNASLLYRGVKNGIKAQLSMVYTGYRIETVSNYYNNDEWQTPYWELDFVFNKKIGQHFEMYLKIKNLLDRYNKVVIKQPLDKLNAAYPYQGSPGDYFLTRRDNYGRSFRLGVRYKF